MDLVLGTVALVATGPLWLVFACAIKVTDGGPVFFCQERVGKDKRLFRVRKFRSMRSVDRDGAAFLQATNSDPRVTPIGRFLRATALDELPQLLSILRGEMSFVGPRALAPDEIEVAENGESIALESVAGFEARHRTRPGLTGLAQVYAPRTLPRRHKFKYDILYIKKQTLWLDLQLIGLSMARTLAGGWDTPASWKAQRRWRPASLHRQTGWDRRTSILQPPPEDERPAVRRT